MLYNHLCGQVAAREGQNGCSPSIAVSFGIIAATLFVGIASAEEKEPVAVLQLGGATAWNVPGSGAFGPTASVEFEPIKDNLLIEAGVTRSSTTVVMQSGTLTSCFGTRSSYRRKWSSSPASARA